MNINDTLQCIRLMVENPAAAGELRICNQFVEVFSILDLAERVVSAGRALGLTVEIDHLENPRLEAASHYYNPAHTKLSELGLQPHLLTEDVLMEMIDVVRSFSHRIDRLNILPTVRW